MLTPHFQKSSLPVPRAFYESELGRLSRADCKGRVRANCPFHKSKSKTTLSVNLRTGAFNCFSCGARGGDVIDFVRLRNGLSFKEAALRLGAWDSAPSPETVRRIMAADRERERKRCIEQEQRSRDHAERMRVREQLHLAMRLQREAAQRLDELRAGAEPVTDNEPDDCWAVMSLALDYERHMAREYQAAVGLESEYAE